MSLSWFKYGRLHGVCVGDFESHFILNASDILKFIEVSTGPSGLKGRN